MTVTSCPKCGYDLIALHALTIGDLRIEHDGAVVMWRGRLVMLSRAERLIVMCLARADGAVVNRAVVAESAGYDGDDPSNWVSVLTNRINNKFRYVDPQFDEIESLRGIGLRWRTP